MSLKDKFQTGQKIIWCPGCGNFGIFQAVQKAFQGLGLEPWQVFVAYGIGCHGHLANYLKTYGFQGIHGRALPLATGVKIANKDLTVLAVAGDGDQLGEGGNHLIHACRKNPDITCLIHNNQLYSLTVGQASPTSEKGARTRTTPQGVVDPQLNPVALAIASGATFVARSFAGDMDHLTGIITKAIEHKGFALVDILQPCVTLNPINTFTWFKERVYKLEETNHQPQDKSAAFEKSLEWGKRIPIGVFYQEQRPTLEDNLSADQKQLASSPSKLRLEDLLNEFR